MQKSFMVMLAVLLLCPSVDARTEPDTHPSRAYESLPPYRTSQNILNHPNINASTVASQCVDDYFEFADSLSVTSRQATFQAWTAAEKDCVRGVLQQVFHKCPGLVVHAASGRKIALLRASTLQANSSVSGIFEAVAVTRPEGLLFSKGFFASTQADYQYETVIHELVHSADLAGEIGFSKEWVDFAEPTISALRWKNKLHHPGLLSDSLVKGKWVSFYGTDNLREALAEYYTCAVHGFRPDYKCSPAFAKFAERIACPSAEDLQFQDHFKNARVLLREDLYNEAITELEQARNIDPNCPNVYTFLAASYLASQRFDDCLTTYEIALSLYKKSGANDTEPDVLYLYEVAAEAMHRSGKYKEAIGVLDKLIAAEHNQERLTYNYYLRGLCYEKLGQLAESASDYYAHYRQPQGPPDYRRVSKNHNEVLARIDEDIRTEPERAAGYEVRAQYKEYLGDLEKNKSRKDRFYQEALNDLATSRKCDDVKRNHSLICSAKLYLKLDDRAEAKQVYEQARALDSEDIETRIFNLKLLQSNGKHVQSHRHYARIISDMKGDRPIEVAPLGDFLPKLFDNIG